MDKWVSRFYFVGGGDLKEFPYCIRIVLNPSPKELWQLLTALWESYGLSHSQIYPVYNMSIPKHY